MPPTTPTERAYADGIDMICEGLGYEAAYSALDREYSNAAEATKRQVFHIEGAFMRDLVEIVKAYPNWSIRFINGQHRPEVEIKAPATGTGRVEQEEIKCKINAAFDKRNRLPGVPGVKSAFQLSVGERKTGS
jgi:hypothetical protein